MNIPNSPKVLFVEDDESIKLVMLETLQDAGFEVIEAGNASEAIARLETGVTIDVLFTDVRMPGDLDGLDLAMHVRRAYPDMPLLIASGYAAKLTARLQSVRQPRRFVDKPYDIDRVVELLWGLLGKK